MNELDELGRKTLLLLAERGNASNLIAPLGLPEGFFVELKTPSGTTYGWELTETGNAAMRQVVEDRIAALQAALATL